MFPLFQPLPRQAVKKDSPVNIEALGRIAALLIVVVISAMVFLGPQPKPLIPELANVKLIQFQFCQDGESKTIVAIKQPDGGVEIELRDQGLHQIYVLDNNGGLIELETYIDSVSGPAEVVSFHRGNHSSGCSEETASIGVKGVPCAGKIRECGSQEEEFLKHQDQAGRLVEVVRKYIESMKTSQSSPDGTHARSVSFICLEKNSDL